MSVHNFANAIVTGSSGQGGGVVEQSLKFNDDESQYLSWTPAGAGNTTTYTVSFWIKGFDLREQTIMSAENGSSQTFIKLRSDGQIQFGAWNGSSYDFNLRTTALHRDPSAFYHFVCVMDGGNATSNDRQRIYVNGERRTSFTHEVYTTSGQEINTAVTHYLGRLPAAGSTQYLNAYLSDVHFIDGQALTPTSFGQTINGYWAKKDYSGSYGANGFKLHFRDDVVSEGFNTVTWKGNSPQSQSISGLGFSPDLVWIKSRSQTYNHVLADTVRGQGKDLYSNTTDAESSSSTELISFDADGFSVGAGGSANDPTGSLGFVAWCWDAGNGSPVSNTDGTITSTVKANPDYGFSIVSYTGNGTHGTIGHGLSGLDMLIVKDRSTAENWAVWHSGIPITQYLRLNSTNAAATPSRKRWNDTSPTSTVFSVGDSADIGDREVNQNGENYIAYCFAEKTGYSKIGTYSGTGASGNSITGLGFKPAFLLAKLATGGTGSWILWDNTRDTNDADVDNPLFPHSNSTEFTSGGTYDIQFDSDGFTINNSSPNQNGSGSTYIYMAFADTREAAFWKDVSGENNNNWTPNNLDYRDSLIGSPANNFATFNALNLPASAVLSEGNLKFTQTANDRAAAGNMAISSGKWYFEVRYPAGTNPETGLAPISQSYANSGATNSTDKLLFITNSGGMRTPAWATTDTTGLSAQTSTTILGFAVDADNGKMFISVNGTYFNSGDPAAGTNPQATFDSDWLDQTGGGVVPLSGIYTGTSGEVKINFGQDSTFAGATAAGGNTDDNGIGDFKYAPPTGFLTLCTENLPTPTIVDGSEHFNTVLFNGTGANQTISGFGFQPDFVWNKTRNEARHHTLNDSVRGGGHLKSSNTDSEGATTISAYNSDGYDWTYNAANNWYTGSATVVSWGWKAGGTAVSNTDGSITSQVSANTTAGFSIVSYTGTGSAATIGHGLSSVPDMIITKARGQSENWGVYHSDVGNNKALFLNLANAESSASNAYWNNTSPTSSVFSVNTSTSTNAANTMIAYCFAEIEGFSKFGSYTGNGSTDGPFIYTGFRPAWIMWKSSTQAGSGWYIVDTRRNPYNETSGADLYAQGTEAEPASGAGNMIDINSNGFKHRSSRLYINGNGATYIYMAFAESPFKYSNAR